MATKTEAERLEKVLEQLAQEVAEANAGIARIEALLSNFIEASNDRAKNMDARLRALEERPNGPAE